MSTEKSMIRVEVVLENRLGTSSMVMSMIRVDDELKKREELVGLPRAAIRALLVESITRVAAVRDYDMQ